MKFKNELFETIYTRRSVRKYLDKKVPKYVINKLLNAAVMAPSARNVQPWHFSIVSSKNKVQHFAELALDEYKLLGKLAKPAVKLTIKSIFYNAPLLIVISCVKGNSYMKLDTGLAAQNMFLTAKSLGLGSCWIGIGHSLNNSKKARKELKIPFNHEITATLVFGYPNYENKNIPKRKPKILKWI